MKLIIDVEKDYYETIKYNVEHGAKYKPFEVIANGTPLQDGEFLLTLMQSVMTPEQIREVLQTMNNQDLTKNNQGDLISREALKESFGGYTLFTADTVIEHIDNAPTVEERSYKQGVIDGRDTEFDNGFEQGYAKGYENCEHDNERPQGEWITYNSYYHKCNKCNRFVGFDYADTEHGSWFHFCPNCGADMRGGAE